MIPPRKTPNLNTARSNPTSILIGRDAARARRPSIAAASTRGASFETEAQRDAQKCLRMVYSRRMRTNIDIDEDLVRKARKLTRLKSKRQIVDKALELLVRSESRKGILRYYGSGIWKGAPKAMRRNRV